MCSSVSSTNNKTCKAEHCVHQDEADAPDIRTIVNPDSVQCRNIPDRSGFYSTFQGNLQLFGLDKEHVHKQDNIAYLQIKYCQKITGTETKRIAYRFP